MSLVLRMLDEALAAWRAAHPDHSPAAIRLGERLHAQLLLDVAAADEPRPHLETARGRPVCFHGIDLFCDDQAGEVVRVM